VVQAAFPRNFTVATFNESPRAHHISLIRLTRDRQALRRRSGSPSASLLVFRLWGRGEQLFADVRGATTWILYGGIGENRSPWP
jgi:hypothetical protein